MSLKGKKGSWSLPKYSDSGVIGFSNPLGESTWTQGADGTNPGMFGFDFNPETQGYYDQMTAMRDSIYKTLGYTSPAREASLNKWEDTFNKEALRTTMPRLEQTLFARGLGGSKFYNNAITDLLSKVATQGVLNREKLSTNDEQMKLNYLASINPEVKNLINQANSLSGASYKATNKQYSDLMPYLAKWREKKGYMDMAGGGAGLALALGLAPFTGGASLAYLPMAYAGGSTVGGMFNKGPQSGMGATLESLASQMAMKKMFPKTPVKPQ